MRIPPLYRLSRAFRRISLVALVLLIVFVASAIYSAVQLRSASARSGPVQVAPVSNDVYRITTSVNLSNPSFYPIDGLTLAAIVELPSGTVLAQGGSTPQALQPHGSVSIPLEFQFNLSTVPGALGLLTNDARLPTLATIDATYAMVFGLRVVQATNVTWGAPLANFTATPLTPVVQTNGSVSEPVRVSFDNHAKYAVTGSLVYRVADTSGFTCASGSIPVNTPPGSHFDQNVSTSVASGCDPRGGTLYTSFVGPAFSLALPPRAVP